MGTTGFPHLNRNVARVYPVITNRPVLITFTNARGKCRDWSHCKSCAGSQWAFGVTLWELMTLGQTPYIDIDPFEMSAYLKDGYRIAQPINCPDELYVINTLPVSVLSPSSYSRSRFPVNVASSYVQ